MLVPADDCDQGEIVSKAARGERPLAKPSEGEGRAGFVYNPPSKQRSDGRGMAPASLQGKNSGAKAGAKFTRRPRRAWRHRDP